jgi:hypothetical protein
MGNKSVSIAQEHREEIITRMAQGEPITAIAASLGYASHSGIIERLGHDKDYQDALKSGLIGKIEKREYELECADTNVTVTRADRLLGHARWWAERLDPARFSPTQKVAGADGGPLTIEIVTFASTQVEHEPIADAQSTAPLPIK